MEPKQLANVLVKIMGLWFCASNVMSIVSVVFAIIHFSFSFQLLFEILPFALGLWLILGSQWFVEKLYQNDR